MDRLAHAVILSWGWRRRAIAFASGAISALAMPPFFAFPLLWLTFPVLVWLIDGAVAEARSGRVRRILPAFAVGWWFGFGYFLAGLWWIGNAFLVEGDTFAWLLPFAVIGLPVGLAILWGVGVALAQLFWCGDWRRVFALAAGLFLLPLPHSVWMLAPVIALVPIGTALLFPATTALTTHLAPDAERGQVLGVAQTFGGLARVIAPIWATAAFQTLGIDVPFHIAAAIVAVVIILAFQVKAGGGEEAGGRSDAETARRQAVGG